MGQWDDNQKEDSGLTEIEQMQLDAVLLETAYENFKHGHEAVLAFDPDEGPELTEFENMIAFYIETEEYERCAKIRDIMLNSYPQSVND